MANREAANARGGIRESVIRKADAKFYGDNQKFQGSKRVGAMLNKMLDKSEGFCRNSQK